jgi:hypothetical protein
MFAAEMFDPRAMMVLSRGPRWTGKTLAAGDEGSITDTISTTGGAYLLKLHSHDPLLPQNLEGLGPRW